MYLFDKLLLLKNKTKISKHREKNGRKVDYSLLPDTGGLYTRSGAIRQAVSSTLHPHFHALPSSLCLELMPVLLRWPFRKLLVPPSAAADTHLLHQLFQTALLNISGMYASFGEPCSKRLVPPAASASSTSTHSLHQYF